MTNLLLIGGIGMQEVLLIALVILLFFGGKKIPELMKGLGKGMRSFKEGMNEVTKEQEDTDKRQADLPGAPRRVARRAAPHHRGGSGGRRSGFLLQGPAVRARARTQVVRLHHLPAVRPRVPITIPTKKQHCRLAALLWYLLELNQGHMDFQSIALPPELQHQYVSLSGLQR